MMNTTEFPLSILLPTTASTAVSHSEKRKQSYQRPLLRRSNKFDDDDTDADAENDAEDDIVFLSTSASSAFSRDDDDDVDDTGSTTSRDDVMFVVPALVDEDNNDHCDNDNYSPSFISTPKRQKVIDGIFRPSSSASSSLSPPPLIPKSSSFYHDITALSNDELSFLALPTSSSLSSSFSVTSSPRISLAPRCLEFLPSPSVSFTPATATATATSELEIMKGKRLFDNDDDDETYNCSFQSYADADEEYKEEDPTMDFMKENQDYDTVYNKSSSDNVAIPTRTSRQEFLFRMNTHHDRYSFLNRRFVLRTNNNKNNRLE